MLDRRLSPLHLPDAAGTWSGIDIDLAGDLAQWLGVRLKRVQTTWKALADDVGRNCDLAMGGVSVTLDRAKKGFYTAPCLRDGKTPITLCENGSRFRTLEQIDPPGVRAIVNPGGTNEQFADADLEHATIVRHPDNNTIFAGILAGQADLMITDATETRWRAKRNPRLCAVRPDEPFTFSEKAYLLPRDVVLEEWVDQWLHLALNDGTYARIAKPWLGRIGLNHFRYPAVSPDVGEEEPRPEEPPMMNSAGKHRKRATIGIVSVLGVAAIAAAMFAVSTPDGQAAGSCQGLDTALRNNLDFIAGQQAQPDALSEPRIANRQAVVDLIQQRRQTAGCTGDVRADGANQQRNQAADEAEKAAGGGEVVCDGSTVTLSGEGGEPAASSGQFPVGTKLKVTNLDNDKATTVEVTGVSGSCALLNDAAFEQVREPGKFLIRRAVIERVG